MKHLHENPQASVHLEYPVTESETRRVLEEALDQDIKERQTRGECPARVIR